MVVMTEQGSGVFRRWNKGAAVTGGAGLGDIIDVFQPNRAHLVAESERRRLDIVQTASPDRGLGPIDLDAGTVLITLPG